MDMQTMLAEARERAAAAKAKAEAVKLSADEEELQALLAEEEAAEEAAKAAAKARRKADLKSREDKARAAAKGAYLVKGIDLDEVAEGAGSYVIRSPTKAVADTFQRELEAKVRPHTELYLDFALDCIVDPDVNDRATGMSVRQRLEKFPFAANSLGGEIMTLGGASNKERKRGR